MESETAIKPSESDSVHCHLSSHQLFICLFAWNILLIRSIFKLKLKNQKQLSCLGFVHLDILSSFSLER